MFAESADTPGRELMVIAGAAAAVAAIALIARTSVSGDSHARLDRTPSRRVPDEVELKFEVEIGDESEIGFEITW